MTTTARRPRTDGAFRAPILLPDPAKPRERWVKKRGRLSTRCWVWTGAVTSKGYPSRHVKGESRSESVHRAVLGERLGAPVADDLEAHHLCENELCVNPDHLVALTQDEHREAHYQLALGRKKQMCPPAFVADGHDLDVFTDRETR